MSEMNNGGPAFPAPELGEQDFGQRGAYPGMTLRDYFAGKALEGMLAAFTDLKATEALVNKGASKEIARAQVAYAHADAMLAARSA